jgi:hypothetical protein
LGFRYAESAEDFETTDYADVTDKGRPRKQRETKVEKVVRYLLLKKKRFGADRLTIRVIRVIRGYVLFGANEATISDTNFTNPDELNRTLL